MQPTLNRRTALRAIAALGGVAAFGGIGLYGAEQARASHAINNLDISDPNVVSNDVGDLTAVEVGVAVDIDWNGFEVPVHHLQFIETLDVERGGEFVIEDYEFYRSGIVSLSQHADSSELNDASEPGTTGFIHAEVQIGGSPFVLFADSDSDKADPWHDPGPYNGEGGELAKLEPDTDGATLDSRVTFTKRVRLFDEESSPLTGDGSPTWGPADAVAEGDFILSVENEPSETESSGSGSGSAE